MRKNQKMKRRKVDLHQMNLFDWANKQEVERSIRPKEEAKEILQEEPAQVEDNTSKSIGVANVLLDWPIAKLELTVRTKHLLEKMNIKTIGELLKKSEDELLKCKNSGRKSIDELNKILRIHNLRLRKSE